MTLGPSTVSSSIAIAVISPVLESVSASVSQTDMYVGDARPVYVTGTMNNGDKADLSNAQITILSDHPEVAVMNPDGKLHIVGTGSAALTVQVALNGVTKTAALTVSGKELSSSKTRTTYFTPAKLAAARKNIQLFEWAKSERDGAVAKAEPYLALGMEALWNAVAPQSIPRSYAVNQKVGSPVTGLEINKYGNYPYTADPIHDPWKITDPSSGYKFPTNDFGAYYQSGLNRNGVFDPKLADRSLLVNTLYPEKGPTWGVDDGTGWVDESGNRFAFIAYYAHWSLWHDGVIRKALTALRDAYVYTGDTKYARTGLVLLDRIADVYPDMDTSQYPTSAGYYNSDGGTGKGKIVGSIWETNLVAEFIKAYDAFYPAADDPEVISFLSAKSDQYDLGLLKKSATGIRRNIEDGILRQIYPGVQTARIRGNNGMHQSTLALAAVVLDSLPETKEWLDFNDKAGGLVSNPWRVTGGNISATLVDDVDRDGAGNEASPEYNSFWLGAYQDVADILDGYDLYPAADLYQNVKFRKMYSAQYPLRLSDAYTALIGDAGQTGAPVSYLDKAQFIRAFEKFGDPIFAQLAYELNGNQAAGIHSSIFTENPEGLPRISRMRLPSTERSSWTAP
ncbi:hypothetical protein N6H14_14940 [Paenibacillus sp. CC-CFT747]|nr:hypothetical protein N6H14_14940 [Paenibacillus sp. CC-CFT747]